MAVEIKGLDSLMAKLNAMGGDVLDALEISVKQTTQIAMSDAQANIHNRTGMLSQSLAHGTDVERSESSVVGVVGSSAFYADYVERGTRDEFGNTRNPPYPYLMPAAKAAEPVFKFTADRELRRAIRKAAK